MPLAPNQQAQFDQLIKAGAPQEQAMQAASLVPTGTAPVQTTQPNISLGGVNQPVAQAPSSPAPQIPTPSAPAPQPTAPTTPQPTATQQTQPLTFNGSVVDLLNTAGQDSSYAARQQLAKQFGIQGYTGTGAQNQDLAKKFLDAHNNLKGKTTPDTGAQAASALDSYFTQDVEEASQEPVKDFFDIFGSMNPIESSIFQQLSTALATPLNQQSLTDFYKQEVAAQGIPELNMELADINRIMEGTEDDIRDEISNAGGFVTESQVQALTGARNKTLLKKANYLTNVLSAKNDYVDRIVSLTQADREQVSKDFDRKLGISKTLFDMTQQMTNNAKENYKMIVDSVGWEGLAASMKGNKKQIAQVEKMFGMAPGELDALAKYKKPLTEKETLDLENQRLQNQKLRGDLAKGPSVETQVVDVNGKKVLINSKTGQVIANIDAAGGGNDVFQLAVAQQQINTLDGLIQDSYLGTAVGPNPAVRTSFLDVFTGGKSNFIASVEQIRSDLTIDKLSQAKGAGVTFGALSDPERLAIAAAATKLGSVALKDDAGNVYGYDLSEADFKKELDVINNFAKLDFVLKGGEPSAVGIVEMDDGTLWTQNSNGTKVKLR